MTHITRRANFSVSKVKESRGHSAHVESDISDLITGFLAGDGWFEASSWSGQPPEFQEILMKQIRDNLLPKGATMSFAHGAC